jgi:four helix bundle protein
LKIRSHGELDVYKLAFEAAMKIFELTKHFPVEEKYSLTDQIRRSSRSVCANISEAFRKRRYPKSFIAKLNDAEGEAAETQTWIGFAFRCNYLQDSKAEEMNKTYDRIIGKLVVMSNQPENWSL